MNTVLQPPLQDDWIVTVNTPKSQPYQDGERDYNDNIPCTSFRHYATPEDWYQYTCGYLAAKLVDEWAQGEAADLEDSMDEVYWMRWGC